MHQYKVTTATGDKYTIKVNQDTIRKLKKDKVIVKYEKVRNK